MIADDTLDVLNDILPCSEQNMIFNAGLHAFANSHVDAEVHRCYAGYDIGVMDVETKAGR